MTGSKGGRRRQAQGEGAAAVDPFEEQQRSRENDDAKKQQEADSGSGSGSRLAMLIIGFACLRFATNAVEVMNTHFQTTHVRSTYEDQPLVQVRAITMAGAWRRPLPPLRRAPSPQTHLLGAP